MKMLLPNLFFADFTRLTLGPVEFLSSPSGVEVSTEMDLEPRLVQNLFSDSLHLLYFAAGAYKIYNEEPPDPIRSFFQKKKSDQTVTLTKDGIDSTIFPAFSELLYSAYTMGSPKRDDSKKFIQAILFLLNRYLTSLEDWECPDWHHYLELALGFEALFNFNPSQSQSDLRQKLRPILHLKFSSPVELLWKWVDLFFMAKTLLLKGQIPNDLNFNANPDIQSPLYLIGEKLLIFSIYDILFHWHLSLGIAGTETDFVRNLSPQDLAERGKARSKRSGPNEEFPMAIAMGDEEDRSGIAAAGQIPGESYERSLTPDRFAKISPERVLVYFWTKETLEKKLLLLSIAQEDKELEMLLAIKNMHERLHIHSN